MCLRAQRRGRDGPHHDGAPVPEGADAVVKYEIVDVLDGDGNEGSRVRFSAAGQGGGERSLGC